MTSANTQMKNFLRQLYQMSDGDTDAAVSMYDIGAMLGLEKSEAGTIAEDLIIDGYAELKTLSGGITITAEGLQALDVKVLPSSGADAHASNIVILTTAEILDAEALPAVEKILEEIKAAVGKTTGEYGKIEELVIDIKTLETQLLSGRPKTAIAREILRSLSASLKDGNGDTQLTEKIRAMIGGH